MLGYNQARQRELLAQLGFDDVKPVRLIGLLAMLIAVIMALYVLVTRQRTPRPDPVQRAYLDFCRKLARAGVVRAPQEGALVYAARATQHLPLHAAAIWSITHFYIQLRYGGSGDAAQRAVFARLVSSLSM